MHIDEKIVIEKPMTVQKGTLYKDGVWTRRAIMRAIWDLRKRMIREHGVDLFQVYEMSDCIEVHVEGDFTTIPADDGWEHKKKRRAFKKR